MIEQIIEFVTTNWIPVFLIAIVVIFLVWNVITVRKTVEGAVENERRYHDE